MHPEVWATGPAHSGQTLVRAGGGGTGWEKAGGMTGLLRFLFGYSEPNKYRSQGAAGTPHPGSRR